MGQVFAAVHEHLDREVAIKVLLAESAEDPQIVARFLQEGRALGQLRHPGIVHVHDCAKLENGTIYLAMDLLSGKTLATWRQEAKPSLGIALTIGQRIADAMVEVHDCGMIHRDLKPENIILVPSDAEALGFRVTIVDFGIAKVPAAKYDEQGDTHVKTAAHDVLGTALYMAPEQCSNAAAITDRADVYALGGILFELLSGRCAFEGTENVELLYQHVRVEPPHLHELVPTIPPALSVFIASMLAKSPEQRPSMRRCRDIFARSWEHETRECPFPGLQAFSESQAELFFGREEEQREIDAALGEMRSGSGRCWLQIEGHSGVGKTSLVQAGVLPGLSTTNPGAPWVVVLARPSEDPLRSLANAIVATYKERGLDRSVSEVESAFKTNANALVELLSDVNAANPPLLLVLEQFEELFALGGAQLQQFDMLISKAMTSAPSPLRMLTTLRTDYVHKLEQTPELARLLNRLAIRYCLRPMSEEGLAKVIGGMASLSGLRLAEGLATRMVRDATGADSRLPLLGHTLRSLWLSGSATTLTHEQYEKLGGVTGALSREAEVLLDGLGDEGRERAKWLVLDLVQVGRGAPDTRRPRSRTDVLKAAGNDQKAEEVFARLSGMSSAQSMGSTGTLRLLVFSGNEADASLQRVDLVHETLLQQVPIVVAWIQAERLLLERHADLEIAAQSWEHAGFPVDGLPSGSLLAHYRGHAVEKRQRERFLRMASERARRFLEAAERLERRGRRLQSGFVAGLLMTTLLASISTVVAWQERRVAKENRDTFIQVTDEFVGNADWKLARRVNTIDIRRPFLEQIDKNLSNLPDQNEPMVRDAVVSAKHRRSDLERLNGTLANASGFVTAARKQIDLGLKDEPGKRDLLMSLAWNLSKNGKLLLARGQFQDAHDEFEKSVQVLESMGGGDEEEYRQTLGTSYSEQAQSALELDRTLQAQSLFDKSIGQLERLPLSADGYNQALLADTLNMRAFASQKGGGSQEATRYAERALSIQKPLFDQSPGNTLYQLYLARIYLTLAALRFDQHEPRRAGELFDLAIAHGVAMHMGDPTQKDYALLLCQGLLGAEGLALSLGEAVHAEQMKSQRCVVARDLLEQDPEDARFKRFACP